MDKCPFANYFGVHHSNRLFSHAEIYRNVLEGCLPIWHEPQHQFYLRCSGVHSGKEHRSHPVYGRPKGSKLSSE